jgi:hypothetical protein
MVHDPRVGGGERARQFFALLAREKPRNEFVFELFYPAGDEFSEMVAAATAAFSLEIRIESPSETLRARNAKFAYPGRGGRGHDSQRVAPWLPQSRPFLHGGHTRPDCRLTPWLPPATVTASRPVSETTGACSSTSRRSPPFLDPGSRAFENPGFGYRKRLTTVEEHRWALLEPSWKQLLSYETDAYDRRADRAGHLPRGARAQRDQARPAPDR